MTKVLFKNARIVNRGQITEGDLLTEASRIKKMAPVIDHAGQSEEIDCKGMFLLPGIIDDQVHFREPGLTHKANIATESRAAAAGGVTSFMEMPNTKPSATTQELLQDKYDIAAATSTVNYSFYMGASNDNLEEVLKTDGENVCGVKVFMGSSTGNMLVDNYNTLDSLYSKVPLLITTHCEDEQTIRKNLAKAQEEFGGDIPVSMHPVIRNEEACLLSSSLAAGLAKKHGTRLHILHISTADEIKLFRNDIPLEEKNITAELCVHHLFFDASYYDTLGAKVKCNPAIKSGEHREALLKALKEGYFDVIATDHAPHTMEEKNNSYMSSPSGLPLIQHSLTMMMDFYHRGELNMEFIVEKMCHSPARLFRIQERGYLDEGMYADIVLLDASKKWEVSSSNVYYKCGWTPLEGMTFNSKVISTMCNGEWVYKDEKLTGLRAASRLKFKAP
jgi:dihydroorotase